MRKIINKSLAVLCIFVIALTIGATSCAATSTLLGDVNLDGTLSNRDATVIQEYLALKITLTDEQKAIAKVADGKKLSVIDVTLIQKKIVNLIGKFPVEDGVDNVNTKKNTIKVGNTEFNLSLEDNDTAKAFRKILPLTLNMSDLNGNEKYYYLDESLPSNQQNVGNITAGDVMLYGDDCIVIFYKSFSTSYKYTKIGHITNPDKLPKALGSGSVKVTFE